MFQWHSDYVQAFEIPIRNILRTSLWLICQSAHDCRLIFCSLQRFLLNINIQCLVTLYKFTYRYKLVPNCRSIPICRIVTFFYTRGPVWNSGSQISHGTRESTLWSDVCGAGTRQKAIWRYRRQCRAAYHYTKYWSKDKYSYFGMLRLQTN